MAASAISHRTPPCSVPIGLAWRSLASNSTTASPGWAASSLNPINRATGGSGSSPRSTFCVFSSIVVMGILPSVGAASIRHCSEPEPSTLRAGGNRIVPAQGAAEFLRGLLPRAPQPCLQRVLRDAPPLRCLLGGEPLGLAQQNSRARRPGDL